MKYHYVWFLWSSAFLVPWIVLYATRPGLRREMLQMSLWTSLFGLTEPLFVPEYWNPPSLFELARRTGFDIESLIFCFAVGGIGMVLYNVVTGKSSMPLSAAYRRLPLHRHHKLAIATPFIVSPALFLLPWNPIYPAIVAMAAGAFANILCRPDLKRKTWAGGLLFLLLYTIYIGGLELIVPGYIAEIWNMGNLSGVMILRIPVEEILFAFTFGMYWAGVYEHLSWRRTVAVPSHDENSH